MENSQIAYASEVQQKSFPWDLLISCATRVKWQAKGETRDWYHQLQSSKNKSYQKHAHAELVVPKGPIDEHIYSPHGLCHLAEATVKQNAHRHPSTRLCLFSKCCFSGLVWSPVKLPAVQTSNPFSARIQSMGCGEPRPLSFLAMQSTS